MKKTIRMRGWDYTSSAVYLVTICTAKRCAWFGDLMNGFVDHTSLGLVAEQFWQDIHLHFSYVLCDAFVVMPDHVHGILVMYGNVGRDARSRVPTEQNRGNKFGPLQRHSLQAVVHAYKGSVTRWAHRNEMTDFRWQPRFHERRIRSFAELESVRTYIQNNPLL